MQIGAQPAFGSQDLTLRLGRHLYIGVGHQELVVLFVNDFE